MWYYCGVTRMLVSYDLQICLKRSNSFDCRVTRMLVSYDLFRLKLTLLSFNCRVTRMLVSYDIVTHPVVAFVILQGHQNVGELRLVLFAVYEQFSVLQGHQNVGELRHLNCCSVSYCNCFAFKM